MFQQQSTYQPRGMCKEFA